MRFKNTLFRKSFSLRPAKKYAPVAATQLKKTWQTLLRQTLVTNTGMKARIVGVSKLETFEFVFDLLLGETFVSCDNLSMPLQSSNASASDGQRIANTTVMTLMLVHTDLCYDLFWVAILLQQKCAADEPSLGWRRKLPARFEESAAAPEFPTIAKEKYKQSYLRP